MGWHIWWLSGPLSEVCLSVQDFVITMLDAAGKLGVLLPRCHHESTAWKQITKYICWPESVTQSWQCLCKQNSIYSRK